MNNVIIGTAGHVDHGKTLLVKALTGIDTDRLAEEKKRGITIELGFAHLDFPGGLQASIVDVPGHEKFIRNMLAGSGGIDLAMLVVAADEGFMPQTVEHLNILTLLGIQRGLVVLTKTDLVEPDWLDMVSEDVAAQVKGTFLEGKPILPTSAHTGAGIEELRAHLLRLVEQTAAGDLHSSFRLPIDRVFSVDGFGTVVTGTLIEGQLREGELAEVAPTGLQAKVRSLQVHGKEVPTAYAGQRVAINLAGVKKSGIARGNTVVRPGSVTSMLMFDARLRNLKDSQRVILNRSQVHLYHGAAVSLAKVILLDREELLPGESCFAQLRLSEPLVAKIGDRFVIRFYSPLETIGGGVILDDAPRKHRKGTPELLAALRIRESGSGAERALQAVADYGAALPAIERVASRLAMPQAELEEALRSLLESGSVLELLPGRYLAASVLEGTWQRCDALLADYHRENPLHAGVKVAELRQKVLSDLDRPAADAIFGELVATGRLRREGDRYALSGFEVRFTPRQSAIGERLMQLYREAGLEVPSVEEAYALFDAGEKKDCRQMLESLVSSGELVMLSPELAVTREVFERARGVLKGHFAQQKELTLAQCRDLLGTSRKYALAVLEYCDRNKVTRKVGDARELDQGF